MGYQISPVGAFPPAADQGFPRFIQFQQDGVDVGGTTVEVVDFVGDVSLSLSTDGGTLTVDVAPRPFNWNPVLGDYTIEASDALNGLRMEGGSGVQMLYLPDDPLEELFSAGDAILIFQAGDAAVEVAEQSGINLLYNVALTNRLTGQFSTATLIRDIEPNTWILCGDLEYAEF